MDVFTFARMKSGFRLSSNQQAILGLAAPLIAGQLSQIIISITDALMVGRLGYIPLASASLMISILSIPVFACLGLTYIISSLVAEHRGRNEHLMCFDTAVNASLTVMLMALATACFLQLVFPLLLHMGQDPEVVLAGKRFYMWIVWSLVPMSGFICLKQFYDGIELTRVPMLLSGFSIGLNLLLNFVFIYGWFGLPAYGLEGSGMASFATRILAFLFLLLHMSFNSSLIPFGLWKFSIHPDTIRKFLRLAIPSSWQHTSEVAAFSVLAIIAGWFGPRQQAAHQIAITIAAFSYVIYVGLGMAASIRIGESYGRQDLQQIYRNGKDSVILTLIFATFMMAVLIMFRSALVSAFNKDGEVIAIAGKLLLFAAAFQYSDAMQALGIGMLRGMQDVRVPTAIMTFSYWIIGIPSGYFLSTRMHLQTEGIWVGFIVCLSVAAFFLIRRFFLLANPGAPSD